jgi:phage terminase large subunit
MIEVHALDQFKVLYKLPGGINILIAIGGRGGAKTYEISKFIAYSSTIKKKRCVVLRDEKELIRESILNEVLLRFDTANAGGALAGHYSRLDTGIKDKGTGEMLVFTKGFRASAKEKKANLKSISDIDIAVVEEAEDIRDEEKFNTFADSIRKEGSLIIIILNTPDINHWVIKRYFNLVYVEDGFYDIVPKEIDGFLCIKTSYKDNPFLPAHIIRNYENYGNPTSHLFNRFYYLTAIKGYASTGRRGQIITKAKPIKLADYLQLPFKEVYGLDFGTASPAGIVGVKIDKSNVYARQLNYLPMNTLDIAKFFCRLKLNIADLIVADSADPKSIKKLQNGYQGHELVQDEFMKYPGLGTGFNVKGARKGPDSVAYGIDLIDQLNLYVVEESTDFWNEIHSYVYDQDKNGNYTNEPIDDFNHLIDPLRYVLTEIKQANNIIR